LLFVLFACSMAIESDDSSDSGVSAFHDDPDEIASPNIEKSDDDDDSSSSRKPAFAMLRGGKKPSQEKMLSVLNHGMKMENKEGMSEEKAKALFDGGVSNEDVVECLNPHSSVVALVLEISMTPIMERFYLGYRTGPWFAFVLALFFGMYFFCINGRWCDPIFSFLGSKMKTDDEVKTAAFFKTCGFVTMVTAAIFTVCCVLWAIIDFGMIVTGHMEDSDGCPLTGL